MTPEEREERKEMVQMRIQNMKYQLASPLLQRIGAGDPYECDCSDCKNESTGKIMSEWIRVEDRLPKHKEEVLSFDGHCIYITCFKERKGITFDD